MTREQYSQIRKIAARNIERMRDAANDAREQAGGDPLNALAFKKAIETRAHVDGYEEAVHTLLDGMVGLTMEAT